nr:MAG TPA: hypothetical protein [Caudoviricetes sp.]
MPKNTPDRISLVGGVFYASLEVFFHTYSFLVVRTLSTSSLMDKILNEARRTAKKLDMV